MINPKTVKFSVSECLLIFNCITLMANAIEHLFMYLVAIRILFDKMSLGLSSNWVVFALAFLFVCLLYC